jgi:hypothetical protein
VRQRWRSGSERGRQGADSRSQEDAIPGSLRPSHLACDEQVFYAVRVAEACPRCLEFEEQVRELQQRLMASGQYVAFSPGPNPNPNVDRELQRWLNVHPHAGAAEGFRAGWARLARFVGPKLREGEARWLRAMRENDRLRSRIGSLLREISRLTDGG